MILKEFNELPEKIKNDYVLEYYNILKQKKLMLLLKRILDFMCALILLMVLSPVLIVLAILIKIDSKGPVFYRQERITKYGKTFKIFKFRTMIQDADKRGALITGKQDSRITKIGNKIRKCRLDELPQLINILKGEMSFVGTRPEVKKYVDMYTDEMKATLLMPAGVTSMASIKFKDEDEIISKEIKNGKTIDEAYMRDILPKKMKWNLEYIKKFSIWEDFKICIETVIKVGK